MTGASVAARERWRLELRGAVQGVGFRPFAYRLARRLGVSGFVRNSPRGVTLEAEGSPGAVARFRRALLDEAPGHAVVEGMTATPVRSHGDSAFRIRESENGGAAEAVVLPDLATCAECLRELGDPADRRYRYPFTNCTACGPRYSIVLGLPYDRARTTMARFPLCAACRTEYEDPADRRFHAEPNACPRCGPRLSLLDASGRLLARDGEAFEASATALRAGRILAVKGLGGFHLMLDARDEGAVTELRRRKRREAKPLAVMVASLRVARRLASLTQLEESLLASPQAPIVIVERRSEEIAAAVAPENPNLGILLPYTPLHHLLVGELGFPVVATSGNVSDEPLCTDEAEAVTRLAGIADLFLVHDRPIARPVDDSVVRAVAGRELLLRRARGYAPFPLTSREPLPRVLAMGGHLKNTVALSAGRRIFVSPHVGDLDTEPAFRAFVGTASALQELYGARPGVVACDAHPDYRSTQQARGSGLPVVAVQHHHAHVLAAMADNGLSPPVLGFAWDGSGYGPDGTVWGGETLRVTGASFERLASLRPFRLPGGERAVREPRRSALGLCHALRGGTAPRAVEALFSTAERDVLLSMLDRGVNSPWTTSAGRLFDGVAALLGLHPVACFEGQAAMALEFALAGRAGDQRYDFALSPAASPSGPAWVVDWGPLLEQVLADVARGAPAGDVSLRFHNALAEAIVAVASRCGAEPVVLTGGCFQNRYLTERAVARLQAEGRAVFWHRRIPPNDGGLAVGQLLAAAYAGEG